jgi:hypothetical protein
VKLSFSIDGDLRAIYGTSIIEGKRAVTAGVTQAGEGLQSAWRGQILSSGLGPKLARTIRRQTYPKGGTSLRAAALVWSKAAKLVDAFDRGVTIRSNHGFFLAIPLRAAGAKGLGNKRITPGGWEARTGRRLTFIYRRSSDGGGILVDTGEYQKSSYLGRDGFHKQRTNRRKKEPIPIFALVPQVRLPKKLELDTAAAAAQAALPQLIVSNWRDEA